MLTSSLVKCLIVLKNPCQLRNFQNQIFKNPNYFNDCNYPSCLNLYRYGKASFKVKTISNCQCASCTGCKKQIPLLGNLSIFSNYHDFYSSRAFTSTKWTFEGIVCLRKVLYKGRAVVCSNDNRSVEIYYGLVAIVVGPNSRCSGKQPSNIVNNHRMLCPYLEP